jgi:hypothetical protein
VKLRLTFYLRKLKRREYFPDWGAFIGVRLSAVKDTCAAPTYTIQ